MAAIGALWDSWLAFKARQPELIVTVRAVID